MDVLVLKSVRDLKGALRVFGVLDLVYRRRIGRVPLDLTQQIHMAGKSQWTLAYGP